MYLACKYYAGIQVKTMRYFVFLDDAKAYVKEKQFRQFRIYQLDDKEQPILVVSTPKFKTI
jgi:hypothetical protein